MLLSRNKMTDAFGAYRDKALKIMKALVRESAEASLAGFNALENAAGGAADAAVPREGEINMDITLAQQIRELSTERYYATMSKIFELLAALVTRAWVNHQAFAGMIGESPEPYVLSVLLSMYIKMKRYRPSSSSNLRSLADSASPPYALIAVLLN